MIQVRIHGRGGQGVVTAADLISCAAFADGHYAQSFPSFGSERTGAPVVSYCRIDSGPIRLREPVLYPDVVLVQDATLLGAIPVCSGLKAKGFVLINSAQTVGQLGLKDLQSQLPSGHLAIIPATEWSQQYLGRVLPNAAMLGATAALTGFFQLESMVQAIRDRFDPKVAQGNIQVAQEAYRLVNLRIQEREHAETD